MKPVINVGIIGLGTVGYGAFQILNQNNEIIEAKVGSKVIVKWAADISEDRAKLVTESNTLFTTDGNTVCTDPEVDIVVETIGGVGAAKSFIETALRNGKNVVTANKELLAKYGNGLLAEAGEHGLDFNFEASVGGGIPIIRPLKVDLAGNRILELKGIVNGTTNYILTRMARDGWEFSDALLDAQKRGYAEQDPTADIDGHDAAYKISILASIAFMSRIDTSSVYREGIRSITKVDTDYARELGYAIKLLAVAKEFKEGVSVRVHPAMVPLSHPLASVSDVFNAIFVRGDAVGDVMFYGRGAGSEAAGSSVVGDIIDIARNINNGSTGRVPCTCCFDKKLLDMGSVKCKNYVRMLVLDKPGVLASIAKVFGDNEVSLESVVQKTSREGSAEIVWLTHEIEERNTRAALDSIRKMDVVESVESWIRVEE